MDPPLGSVERTEMEELERLQRRAYGPGADIAGDAVAQARLSELEAAQHRRLTPFADAAASHRASAPDRAPALGRASSPEGVQESDRAAGRVAERGRTAGPSAPTGPIDGALAAPWRRRWLAILGGAIAALALLAAFVTWMSPRAQDYVLAPDYVLEPGSVLAPDYALAPDDVLALAGVGADVDEPEDPHRSLSLLGIAADDLRRYENFRGLSVWSGVSRYGMTCLLVAHPVQGLREGIGAEGCSPDGVATIADLLLLQTGSLVRFVLRGDHVDVFIHVGRADPNASQMPE